MSEFALLSNKDGDVYHRVGEHGRAECGNLNPNVAERRDTGAVVVRGDDIEFTSSDEAQKRGFCPCGLCFGGENR